MSTADTLQEAVRYVGSAARLSRAVGVSRAAISKAMKTGKVSPRLATKIEEVTGGRVRRDDLVDPWRH